VRELPAGKHPAEKLLLRLGRQSPLRHIGIIFAQISAGGAERFYAPAYGPIKPIL